MAIKRGEFSDLRAEKNLGAEFNQIEVVDDVMCEILRQKSSLERIKIAC